MKKLSVVVQFRLIMLAMLLAAVPGLRAAETRQPFCDNRSDFFGRTDVELAEIFTERVQVGGATYVISYRGLDLVQGIMFPTYPLGVKATEGRWMDGRRHLMEFTNNVAAFAVLLNEPEIAFFRSTNCWDYFKLGLAYYDAKAFAMALSAFKSAATETWDDSDAQYALAVMHAKGQGVAISRDESVKWWARAAKERMPSKKVLRAIGGDYLAGTNPLYSESKPEMAWSYFKKGVALSDDGAVKALFNLEAALEGEQKRELLLPELSGSAFIGKEYRRLERITGVALSVLPPADETAKEALPEQRIRTAAELRLRRAGIKVVPEHEILTAKGVIRWLKINVQCWPVDRMFAWQVQVKCLDTANCGQMRFDTPIWETAMVGSVGPGRLSSLTDAVEGRVDVSANDLLRANQKEN